MRWFFLTAMASLSMGCFSPRYENGTIICQARTHACPDGYHCAINNSCWRDGANDEPRDQHSGHVVFGAGSASGIASEQFRANTSFGQLAGKGSGEQLHSVQFGALAGTIDK
jgi:hypothetical protein